MPCFLFLDLNDIPGNFSNCHDLICTSHVAYKDAGEGFGDEVEIVTKQLLFFGTSSSLVPALIYQFPILPRTQTRLN